MLVVGAGEDVDGIDEQKTGQGEGAGEDVDGIDEQKTGQGEGADWWLLVCLNKKITAGFTSGGIFSQFL